MTASLQTKNGKVYVVLGWRQAGNRRQKWVQTDLPIKYGKRIGEEVRTIILKQWEEKICDNYTDISFANYLRDWVERKRQSIEETTYREYKRMVDNTITPYFDKTKIMLSECTVVDIERFYRHRMSHDGVGANTISHHQACIYSALKDACRLDLISSNPADKVVLPKVIKYRGTYYTTAEAQNLLSAAVGTRLEMPIYMAVWFGMRRGEISGLKWSNIDFENKILIVNGVMSYCAGADEKVQYRGRTKSEAGMRAFPLSDAHITMFKHWKAAQAQSMLISGTSYDYGWKDFVCVDELGAIMSPNYISWAFPVFVKKNDFRKVRFHDLRHTNAAMLLSNGATMQEVQEWLGHENYSTTDEYYGGIMAATKCRTANILDTVLSSSSERKPKIG